MNFNFFRRLIKSYDLKGAVCQTPFVARSKKTFGKSAANSSFRANTRPSFFTFAKDIFKPSGACARRKL
jgi:hypothetical protein